MFDVNFYRSIEPLGEKTAKKFKNLEELVIFLKGQVIKYNIDKDKFYNKEKFTFESDLLKVKDSSSDEPSQSVIDQFQKTVQLFNQELVGFGVKYKWLLQQL